MGQRAYCETESKWRLKKEGRVEEKNDVFAASCSLAITGATRVFRCLWSLGKIFVSLG